MGRGWGWEPLLVVLFVHRADHGRGSLGGNLEAPSPAGAHHGPLQQSRTQVPDSTYHGFRGAPMLLAENCSPGPRYSVNPKILRTGRDPGPAFSILGRYHTKTVLTPGPGDYFPEKSTKYVFDSAPSHSISARTKTFRVDSTPGPAAYMLPVVMGPHAVGKVSQPSFSIKGRSKLGGFSDDLHKTPGPAAYHQSNMQVTKLRAPQYTIAARVEPPGDKTLKPGPGAHSPEKVTLTKPCAPIVTFGIKHSDYMTPLIVDLE
uniref:Outer dense fiber of sperm tails 3 n=2 Tax=Molossus molossus TaxID=27622 RepID=A0A7J8BII4_MOLMO|nr:outer dense fiber of sperm tails 3 [Molossus molossus]